MYVISVSCEWQLKPKLCQNGSGPATCTCEVVAPTKSDLTYLSSILRLPDPARTYNNSWLLANQQLGCRYTESLLYVLHDAHQRESRR